MKAHVVLLVLLFSAPQVTFACSDPDEPSFIHQLDSAKTVAVVRLLSLRLAGNSPEVRKIVGDIQLVRVVKGKPTFRTITYNDLPCGGLRPVVGHYFVIATRDARNRLSLVRGDNSIIDISSDYALTYPLPPERSKFQWHIENYLSGTPFPPKLRERLSWMNIHGAFPPPPPPPPPNQAMNEGG